MPGGKYVRLTPAVHRAISIKSAQRGITNGELVTAAFHAYVGGSAMLQNETEKSSHVKKQSFDSQTSDGSDADPTIPPALIR